MKAIKPLLIITWIIIGLAVQAQDPSAALRPPQDSTALVYVFKIDDMINKAMWRRTQRSFDEAERLNANYVMIHMNTYGGMVDAADSIRTKILNSKLPVYLFIDNNAASAGALISIACDSIYMRKGGNIGAATVVNQSGEVVPDKYQSYMRATMRSTAEAHGKIPIANGSDTTWQWFRDPNVAQAMVDPDVYVAQISDSGKVLTFTASEAMANHFCEGLAESIDDAIQKAGIKQYQIVQHNNSQLETLIELLLSPYLQSILIMIMIGGIYFELQTPGVGFPIAASILSAILYFAPLYLEGLAENWEIILFVVGIILLGIEVFVIPGFGVAGISGIICLVASLALSMVDAKVFDMDGPVTLKPLTNALSLVLVSILISIVGSIILGKTLLTSKASPFRFIVLDTVQKSSEGYVAVNKTLNTMVGELGIAETVLRPSGKVLINDEQYDATTMGNYIDKGDNIKVIKVNAGQLYVRKV